MTTDAVFIVDDDASVRRAIERLLHCAGYTVRSFASAYEVIAAMRTWRPACLVIDVRMPDCTGLELADMLRAAPEPAPVIFITGHGDIELAVRAMKTGAVDFLAKPFDDEALLTAIGNAVRKVQR